MYSLDINFLKNRETGSAPAQGPVTTRPAGSNTPIIIGVVVGLLFPALVGVGWGVLQWRTGVLQEQSAELDADLSIIRQKEARISSLQADIQAANDEAASLASVFNLVKPWSAILQDIRVRIPDGVQIQTIQESELEVPETPAEAPAEGQEGAANAQVPKLRLTISGLARSFDKANDFLLTLQQSNFLNAEETLIKSAQLISYPGSLEIPETEQTENVNLEVELPRVVSYTIETQLTEASASELLQELERRGAVGLVTRIRTLQNQGVDIGQ